MIPAPKTIHFVGVCGTAMAATAAALQERGFVVTGSDQNVYPPMSTFLAKRGIEVMSGYAEANLALEPDLVVIGNAISRGNPEAELVLERKLHYCSLPELLKEFFIRGKRSLVVTGTHGKTTTASLLAWTLEHSGLNPSYLIGGIPENLGQGARFTDSEWIVIEGDEYDSAFFDKRSKFVHYLPEVGIVNNLEFDHADIFDDLAAVQRTFSHFIRLVPRNGLLVANGDAPHLAPLLESPPCPVRTFGLGESCEARADDCAYDADGSSFTLDGERYTIPMIGELNVRNALGVVVCARHCGLTPDQIRSAFASFKGIKRRLQIRGESGGVTIVDDFAHHPTAIAETIKALRVRFPERRLWVAFEPRSNTTRRNIFQKELAAALGEADGVMVSQIARANLLADDERLDPDRLMADIRGKGRIAEYLPGADEIVAYLKSAARPGDVIAVLTNGGFNDIHEKLLAAF
jgi:UDP-N-acetylmuramate: L-alanyl-gamma-D-glutamyl-meso-diaminopimelate ligase